MSKHAYTLIEILIVIIIMGVLAALVYSRITGSVENPIFSSGVHEIQALQASQERYYLDNETYAGGNCSSLDTRPSSSDFKVPTCNSASGQVILERTNGDYTLKAIVRDPNTGAPGGVICSGIGCSKSLLRLLP